MLGMISMPNASNFAVDSKGMISMPNASNFAVDSNTGKVPQVY